MNVKNKLIGTAVALCAASLLTVAPITVSANVHHSMKGKQCVVDGKAVKAKSKKACEKKGGEVVKKAAMKKHHVAKKAAKKDDSQAQTQAQPQAQPQAQ